MSEMTEKNTQVFSDRLAGFSAQANEFEFMLAEQLIAKLDLTTHNCVVLNRDLLPYALYKVDSSVIYDALIRWIQQRTLPVSRKHSTSILKACGLSGVSDIEVLLRNFHALSLTDNYWFKEANSNLTYESINLYDTSFNELVTVALHGELNLSLRDNSPDLNLRGNLAKCYKREDSGIYLYKTSHQERVYAEVFASKLALHCGFDAVRYVQTHHKKKLCSKCPLETTAQISWVPARDITLAGIDPKSAALKLSPVRFYQMLVFDYIAGNIDRHNENWSFEMDNSGRLIGLSKLYDFDNCFLADSKTTSLITLHPLLQDAVFSANILRLTDEWFNKVYGFLNSQQNIFSKYARERLATLRSYL